MALLLCPGGDDAGGAFRPEPRHFGQPVRLLLDDAKGVGAEVLDDAFREDRTNALNQAGAEVALDALDRGWQHRGVGLDLKLLAELGMAGPPADQAQAFPWLRAKQRAHDGDEVAAAVSGHPGDGVAGFLVDVRQPLENRLQHNTPRTNVGRHADHGGRRRA